MSDILYRKSLAASVAEMAARLDRLSNVARKAMREEGPLRIDFRVKNNRVDFNYRHTEIPDETLATAIIEAVQQNWTIEPEDARKVEHVNSEGQNLTFDKHVTFDWSNAKISTSFGPFERQLFLTVLAVLIDKLNKASVQARVQKQGLS